MGVCRTCGYSHDRASSVTDDSPIGEAQPEAGDISICLRCGTVAIFTGVGTEHRPPTDDELAEALADPEVQNVRGATRLLAEQEGWV